jgi:hypothetical protein
VTFNHKLHNACRPTFVVTRPTDTQQQIYTRDVRKLEIFRVDVDWAYGVLTHSITRNAGVNQANPKPCPFARPKFMAFTNCSQLSWLVGRYMTQLHVLALGYCDFNPKVSRS